MPRSLDEIIREQLGSLCYQLCRVVAENERLADEMAKTQRALDTAGKALEAFAAGAATPSEAPHVDSSPD